MSGSPSTSSSESSLRIYGPLVPFEDEEDKSNLDFGYAPSNRRHARRPSRGLVGIWKGVTRKMRKPERASVLPPGFELVAEQRRRSRMLQQIAERNPGLVAPADRSPFSTYDRNPIATYDRSPIGVYDRSPSMSSSSSRSSSNVSYASMEPRFLEQHQRSASYPGPPVPPKDPGYYSPPRSASLYRTWDA